MSIHIFWIWGKKICRGCLCVWECEKWNGKFRNKIVGWVWLYVGFLNQLEFFFFYFFVQLLLSHTVIYSIGCKLILILFLNEMAKQCSKRQMPIHFAFIILCAHIHFIGITLIAFIFHIQTNSNSYIHSAHTLTQSKIGLSWTIFHLKYKQLNPHLTVWNI